MAWRDAEALGNVAQEALGGCRRCAIVPPFIGNELALAPDRLAVAPPVTVQRPARQLLAGVPLALPEVSQPHGRIMIAQAVIQLGGEPALVGSHGGRVPL